jgi:DNA processing protein
MTDTDFKTNLLVALNPGLTAAAWQAIQARGIDASTLFKGGISLWQSLKLSATAIAYFTAPPISIIENCLSWQDKTAGQICLLSDALYPELLKTIQAPPKVLFLQGHNELLHRPQLAIVGSRNPSHAGCEAAERFAHDLARLNWVITSGLALGIDAAAHMGALKAKGQTIAVLGSGLNSIYPKRHQPLAKQIIENGLLLSEYPPDTPPLAPYFPARNRIINGLAVGVWVVEASLRSGSLITARYAME